MRQLELFNIEKNLNLEQKIAKSKEIIKSAFKSYSSIALAWSGGKDSTTLLILTLEVLRETGGELVIVHNDTLIENPVIRKYCDSFLEKLEEYKNRENLNIRIHIGRPKPTNTFWYNVLVKGYPKPNFRFRWCQRTLKIEPSERLLKTLGIDAILVGIREDESIARKQTIQKHYKEHKTKKRSFIQIAPIIFWLNEDVWEFLAIKSKEHTWININEIIQIYRDATGECPIVAGLSKTKKSGCGARFGCWICTLVKDDKSMKNLAKLNITLQPLVDFREWFKEFTDKPENRTGYNAKGEYKGGKIGKLTISARIEIFNRLLNLQKQTDIKVIQDHEIEAFQKIITKPPQEGTSFQRRDELW